jgi:hypothetical protein
MIKKRRFSTKSKPNFAYVALQPEAPAATLSVHGPLFLPFARASSGTLQKLLIGLCDFGEVGFQFEASGRSKAEQNRRHVHRHAQQARP